MKRAILICGVALLALGACSKKTETAATGTAAPTNAPASASAPAGPLDMPSRKAGLWEQTINTEKMHQTVSMCLDADFDRKMKIWGNEARGKSKCTDEHINRRLDGGWDFHATCPMGETGGTVTSDGHATGDFGSHYTVDVTSTTSGSSMPQANAVRKISIEANWKGPCPPDMKPGDMLMAGGVKINMSGGTPTVESGPGGADMAKLKAQAMSGHMDQADIAKLKAQAEAMKKQMKDAQ